MWKTCNIPAVIHSGTLRRVSARTLRSAGSLLELNQADVAQLVEQSIRNRQVIGSSPIVGSSNFFRSNEMPSITGGLCFYHFLDGGDFVGTFHMTLRFR